ncbi:2'-5' RNA ligase superfamily protein [Haloactinopolyspora alba]|uniref:2'-5' RNA ligase superfamily protein n=1 Tax=Haloactinopolyspora alba TaxID=648780 RepID=A0A2P8DYZ7_9ACTN|nr:2'-5' RNA ligase family protein [Haloactinopolyspora alba]PSL02444.1 2'-5' RNA ligase superfamily protein [Haloactinopolyspora alba]
MALAVCLTFDARTEHALRRLWDRLEDLDVPTLRSHTHGRHVPHLSYAVLRSWRWDDVRAAVAALPDGGPVDVSFDGLGTFRRGRVWLAPALPGDLGRRQERTVDAVVSAGAELHRHYLPGRWLPHCTIAPRVPLTALPMVAAAVYDVLPLMARADRAELIDSSTGERLQLPHVP